MRQTTGINRISAVLLLGSASLCAVCAAAEMYKWIDAEGYTHYTQSPPPGGVEVKTIKPPPNINSEQAEKQLQDRQKLLQAARDDRIKTDELKKDEQNAVEKQRAECEKAKARLASYQRPRVNLLDKDGNPSRATEEQRQAELAKSQELIKKLCK